MVGLRADVPACHPYDSVKGQVDARAILVVSNPIRYHILYAAANPRDMLGMYVLTHFLRFSAFFAERLRKVAKSAACGSRGSLFGPPGAFTVRRRSF